MNIKAKEIKFKKQKFPRKLKKLINPQQKQVKEFNKLVKNVENFWGMKATTLVDYINNQFIYQPFKKNKRRFQTAFIYKNLFNIDMSGTFILEKKLKPTESHLVLKSPDGYYGFSHRAILGFKIGDTLFDETWTVPKDHPKYEEWKTECLEMEECYPGEYKGCRLDYIADVVPFNQRGFKLIETDEECFQAALNFGKYVS